MDLTELLPEDVLADILRRLAPRWLATSRRVCRAWRATVDRHGLLSAVAGLLPRSVAGIVLQYDDMSSSSSFLSRPSAGPTVVSMDLDYTFFSRDGSKVYDEDSFEVRGHCNGLILLQDWDGMASCVANPATRRRAHLPRRPPPPCAGPDYFYTDDYLVYDPAVSPYYEVFSIPRVRRRHEPSPGKEPEEMPPPWEGASFTYRKLDPALEELEWPPSPCVLNVFSSRTGQWEERSFVREGAAAGKTVADMRIDLFRGHRYAVYWRGSLYVQCQTDFVMRLSLSNEKYQLIQPPVAFEPSNWPGNPYARRLSIGKSKKGVYSVLIDKSRINVWILDDSDGQIKWVSKQIVGHLPKLQEESWYLLESHGAWMLHDINPGGFDDGGSENQGHFEWDSDNDNILPDSGNRAGYKYYITFLGFHPFKEIIFLNDSFVRVIAYHLNSPKIQDLGYVYPKEEVHWLGNHNLCVERSFPYTPCWMRHHD